MLKNNNDLLPLDGGKIKYAVLVGERAIQVRQRTGPKITTLFQDYQNIGAQNGGWTVRWQGVNGEKFWQGENRKRSAATNIAEGILPFVWAENVYHPKYSSTTDFAKIQQERDQYLNALKSVNPF